jgi:hypothetical protein
MFRQCFTKSYLRFYIFERVVKWFEDSKNAFTARKSHYWSAFEENTKLRQMVPYLETDFSNKPAPIKVLVSRVMRRPISPNGFRPWSKA